MGRKPKDFPGTKILTRLTRRQKEERDLIEDYMRIKMSLESFCKIKNIEIRSFKKLLTKYGVKRFIQKYTYEQIVGMLKEYKESKNYNKTYLLRKWEISYNTFNKWKAHFLIHKDKKGNVKLILIDKEWDIYQDFVKRKEKEVCLD